MMIKFRPRLSLLVLAALLIHIVSEDINPGKIHKVRNRRQSPSQPSLTLDHQTMVFKNETRTIGWKVVDQLVTNCDHFQIVSSETCTHDSRSVIGNWTRDLSSRHITINNSETIASDGVTPLYIDVTGRNIANDICLELPTIVQIKESTITKKISVTDEPSEFEIIALRGSLYVVFPVDNNATPDCMCSIILNSDMSADSECDNLKKCHCFEDLYYLRSDEILFQVCHSLVTDKLSLHMQNLSYVIKNNVRFHFYHILPCIGESLTFVHYYTDSFELIPAASNESDASVNVSIRNGLHKICYSVDNNHQNSLFVIMYQLDISSANDGQLYYSTTALNTTNCTEIPPKYRPILQCVSVTVNVEAIFSTGHSVTGSTNIQNAQMKCSCLRTNFQFQVEPDDRGRSNLLKINFSCNILNVEISTKISLGSENFTRFIMCTKTNRSQVLDNINCTEENRLLNIYAIFSDNELENEPACLLFQHMVRKCEENQANQSNSVITITATCMALLLFGLILAVVPTVIVISYKRRNLERHGTFQVRFNKKVQTVNLS